MSEPQPESFDEPEHTSARTRLLILLSIGLFFLLMGILVAYFTADAVQEKPPVNDSYVEPVAIVPAQSSSLESSVQASPIQESPIQETSMQESLLQKSSTQQSAESSSSASSSAPPILIQGDSKEEIIAQLRKTIHEQQLTIEDLKRTIVQLKDSMKVRLASVIKPRAIVVGECIDMRVGHWNISGACEGAIRTQIETLKTKSNGYILAWEVVPRVDTQPYAGSLPELKQEGLAGFRANETLALLKRLLPQDAIVFKGVTLQEQNKRGFVLRAYEIGAFQP